MLSWSVAYCHYLRYWLPLLAHYWFITGVIRMAHVYYYSTSKVRFAIIDPVTSILGTYPFWFIAKVQLIPSIRSRVIMGTKFGFIHTYIHTYIHFLKTYYSDLGTSKTSKFIKTFSKIFTVTKLSLWESKTAANSLALSFLKLIYRFLLLNWNSKNELKKKIANEFQ